MNRPMTIALVSQEYPPETGGGGIGTQTYLRARGLAARGHIVHVITMSCNELSRTVIDQGATVHRIGEPQLKVPGNEPSTYWLACSNAVAEVITELQETLTFDIIQFPEYAGEGFIFQTDTWTFRKAKYVVQMHGPLAMFAEHWNWPIIGSPTHRVGCFMEEMSLRYADKLLASSRHTAAYCQKAYGVDTHDAGIVYSGIDVNRFAPREGFGDESSPRILFVGGLSGGKGVTDLIRAAGRLRLKYPRLKLRAIGRGDARQLEAIAELVANCNMKENFELLGFVPYEKLPEQYAWCDFFAAPSVYEGGPGNVYLEAMACARPVIACDAGGVPEVVPHEETGLLIKPRDVDGLTAALERLSGDAALRARLGKRARQSVVEGFTIDKYLDKCEGHSRELL